MTIPSSCTSVFTLFSKEGLSSSSLMSVGSLHSSVLIWDIEQDWMTCFEGVETETQRRKTPSCPKCTGYPQMRFPLVFSLPSPSYMSQHQSRPSSDIYWPCRNSVSSIMAMDIQWDKGIMCKSSVQCLWEYRVNEHHCGTLFLQGWCSPGIDPGPLCFLVSPRLQLQLPVPTTPDLCHLLWLLLRALPLLFDQLRTRAGTTDVILGKTVIFFDKSALHSFSPHSPF